MLRRFFANPINWFSVAIAIVGLGGTEDDLQVWAQWLGTAYIYWSGRTQVNLVDILSGDSGRWILVGSGVFLMLITNQVPQKLYRLLRFWKHPKVVLTELQELRAEGVQLRNRVQNHIRSQEELTACTLKRKPGEIALLKRWKKSVLYGQATSRY